MPISNDTDVDFDTEPTLTRAGARLLDAASSLFYERGIRAVGVELIAEQAGTTKKTLYDCFGSKDALAALYLRHRAIRWQQFLLARLDDVSAGDVAGQVLAVFDALAAWHEPGSRGCAFVNAYAEIGAADHPGVAVIRAEKQWMHSLFFRLLDQSGAADPEGLGNHVHLIYEGALVQATAGGRPDAIARGKELVARLLSP